MVDGPRLARLDEEARHRALLGADEVLVDGSDGEKRAERHAVRPGAPVGEEEERHPFLDPARRLLADPLERPLEPGGSVGPRPGDVDDGRLPAPLVQAGERGHLAVGQDRVRDPEALGLVLGRLEEVALRPDGKSERHDRRLPRRVDRGVGDLREELLEVVVEEAGTLGEDGQRLVIPHRAEGVLRIVHHRSEDESEVLRGIAEHPETRDPRGRIRRGRRLPGEVFEVERPTGQPGPVGVRRRGALLDLLVLDDPSLLEVHEEHPPRLEPPLRPDPRGRHIEDADLAREHDPVVVRHPVAARPETVPVENRARPPAVAEEDGRGAVPRLHERGVVAVHRPPAPGHGLVVLPRLGDHHVDGVGEAPAGGCEQLEDVVEHPGVGGLGIDDGEELAEVRAVEIGLEERLPRAHPVHIPLEGVDLPIVAEEPHRLGARPAREGVRAEAGVDERDVAPEAGVPEIGVVARKLSGGELPLVDDRPRGEAAGGVERRLREPEPADAVVRLLADQVEPALEGVALEAPGRPDEDLLHDGLPLPCAGAEIPIVARHAAPPEEPLPLRGDGAFDHRLAAGPLRAVPGKEDHPDPVAPRRGELESERPRRDLAEEGIGKTEEDARPVPGVRLGAARRAVRHPVEGFETVRHDRARRDTLHMRDDRDPAAVPLVGGVEEAVGGRCAGRDHRTSLPPSAGCGRTGPGVSWARRYFAHEAAMGGSARSRR